jgi:hypothetical protein
LPDGPIIWPRRRAHRDDRLFRRDILLGRAAPGVHPQQTAFPGNMLQRCRLPSMPRYFFHIYHHCDDLDRVGEELPDRHAAWQEATVTADRILQGLDGRLKPDHEWRMEVTDEFQNRLFVLHIQAERLK